jgi:hypothetical protein
MKATMKEASGTSLAGAEQKFYLYASFSYPEVSSSATVFYKVTGEEPARTLCRLFSKEYPSEVGEAGFLLKCADEIEADEQILLDEALDWLNQYDDPDPYIYDPHPSKETMMRAEYARRAGRWEDAILARSSGEKKSLPDEAQNELNSESAAPRLATAESVIGQQRFQAEEKRARAMQRGAVSSPIETCRYTT